MLNAPTYPKRNKAFSRAVFIVAPGLTVKERLQVLLPSEGSYYNEFNLCPSEALRQKLNQAEVLIENWHTLMPMKEVDRSVVKKGRESDEGCCFRLGSAALRVRYGQYVERQPPWQADKLVDALHNTSSELNATLQPAFHCALCPMPSCYSPLFTAPSAPLPARPRERFAP
ncbi:hypothetical protein MCELHM10_01035 [Paracoccaceae bacterium]